MRVRGDWGRSLRYLLCNNCHVTTKLSNFQHKTRTHLYSKSCIDNQNKIFSVNDCYHKQESKSILFNHSKNYKEYTHVDEEYDKPHQKIECVNEKFYKNSNLYISKKYYKTNQIYLSVNEEHNFNERKKSITSLSRNNNNSKSLSSLNYSKWDSTNTHSSHKNEEKKINERVQKSKAIVNLHNSNTIYINMEPDVR